MDATFQYYSVAEAASELGCTGGRIRQLLLSGELKGHKLSKSKLSAWVVPVVEVERFRRIQFSTGRPRNARKING